MTVEEMQFEYLNRQIKALVAQVERLQKLLADRSCCCSGCTKHNIALEEKSILDGIGGELDNG